MHSTKPKILVVVESLDVNDSSGTKGRVALILNLAAAGFDLDVLHYTQKDIGVDSINCVSIKENKGSFMYILSRVQRLLYRWFKINIGRTVDGALGFSFGFFNDVSSLAKGIKKYDPSDYQMIWTFGKGTSFRPHAAVLRLEEWHSRWYAYVHDPYPQHLYPRPYNFIEAGYRKKRLFFKAVTAKACEVVFPSLLLKDWMQSYYAPIADKGLIIPHQVAEYSIGERPYPNYFDPNKCNFLHGGNLLNLRDPKPVVEAYSLFLKEHPEAVKNSSLIFLGKESVFDAYLNQMRREIPSLYSSNGYVAFEDVYQMQQNASANIILEANSEISPFLPGKFAHCVGADRPIILVCPYYSECKRLLGDSYPYLYDFNEVVKISKGMGRIYTQWKENNGVTSLERPDLEHYLSPAYLKQAVNKNLTDRHGAMKIMLVSMHSIHLLRWASQLRNSGYKVYWFDISNAGYIKELDWVEQFTGWKYKFSNFVGRYFLKKNLPWAHSLLENDVTKAFEKVLLEVQPDVVHSFVMYSSCVPLLPVMKKYPQIKWIYSAWGNDLFYYRNIPEYEEGIRKVLPELDYMFADCERDINIAREMGLKGERLGVFPGGGGYELEKYAPYRKAILEREIILVKGYEQRFGKAINVIRALIKIQDQLSPYKVVVFGADKKFYVEFKTLENTEFIEIRGKMDHLEVLKLMGSSLVYIGNSESDGMPNTLLEAIIMGAFPIQSNPGGATAEILEHGKNGLLIEDYEDLEEISGKLLKVLSNRKMLDDAYTLNMKLSEQLGYQYIRKGVLEAYGRVEGAVKGVTEEPEKVKL